MSPTADGKLRVLFVEDAFDQALLVKAFLASAGRYQVVHTQDGDQAAKLLETEEWDLLITDLNLPGIDGFELIRICRRRHPDIPAMATTGYTASHYHEEAFRAGAADLMTKPLDKDEFLARVERLVGAPATAAGAQPSIVAVGGLVGDAEMGCGGTLARWAAQGKPVYIVPICSDELDTSGAELVGARAAAATLGVEVIVDEEAMADTPRRVGLVEEVVRRYPPEVLYLPAMDDNHPARREAFRIAKAAAKDVPTVLAYQTATTSMGFRPSRFEEIGDAMMLKMEALAAYQEVGVKRPDLTPRMAQAYARYWGRFQRFTEVEAFEVVTGD